MNKFSNRFMYCFEKALREKLGENGCRALKGLVSAYDFWDELPPLNDLREVDSVYVSKLCMACMEMYGPQQGASLQDVVGSQTLAEVVRHFYPLDITSLHLDELLLAHLQPLFDYSEDLPQAFASDNRLVCIAEQCPCCDSAIEVSHFVNSFNAYRVCAFVTGYIRAAVEHIAPGKRITVEETACRISGEPECRFEVRWQNQ